MTQDLTHSKDGNFKKTTATGTARRSAPVPVCLHRSEHNRDSVVSPQLLEKTGWVTSNSG